MAGNPVPLLIPPEKRACRYCEKTFQRPAALARHQRGHTHGKEHQCPVCFQTFGRRDTLKRHQTIHTLRSEINVSTDSSNAKQARARACVECARARTRCSHGRPCLRCQDRSLSCDYPNGIDPKISKDDSGGLSAIDGLHSPLQATSGIPTQPRVALPPTPRAEPSGFSQANGVHAYNVSPPLEASHNWISVDDSLSIDYDAIIGFGAGVLNASDNIDSNATEGTQWQARNSLPPDLNSSLASPSVNGSVCSILSTSQGSKTITHPSQIHSLLDLNDRDRYGALYADCSDGARLAAPARSGRRRNSLLSSITHSITDDGERTTSYAFPSYAFEIPEEGEHLRRLDLISTVTYEQLRSKFRTFGPGEFPLICFVNYFTLLYFQHFHESFPILHKASLNLDQDWLLTLAIISIGCQYTNDPRLSACAKPLHTFLDNAVNERLEGVVQGKVGLSTLQITILQNIAAVYWKKSKSSIQVSSKRVLDPIWQRSIFLTQSVKRVFRGEPDEWHAWIQQESWIRLKHAVWLLDSMRHYQFGCEPLFDLKVASEQLPSDDLWKARNAMTWSRLLRRSNLKDVSRTGDHTNNTSGPKPPLSFIVQHLINAKTMASNSGYFSGLLVLHGLYSEFRNVARYVARNPPQMHDDPLPAKATSNPWLPSNTTYSRWRNNACDCIDALHWTANEEVAAARGREHPMVLQLHFARTVFLVPHESIRLLVMARSAPLESSWRDTRNNHALAAEQEVIRWAQQDEHKARLAVLHAASCHWHVSRFSKQAFYEPAIVYLTTLTLWAYVSFTPISSEAPTENEAEVTFIHLDRPCDDEIVQAWVRSGRPNSMKAYMAGIGDIFAPQGGHKIINRGCDLLAELEPVWGYAGAYIESLKNLLQVVTRNLSRTEEDTAVAR